MKIAWLCWEYLDSKEPIIVFSEPDDWKYFKVKKIGYFEVEDAP